jgi:uncharacterized protein (DUF1330 family)
MENIMVYALNVFNLIAEKENDYREYSIKAGKIIYGKGGKVISSGWKPIRNIHGNIQREYMIVVEFPSEEIFQEFIDEAEKDNIHPLREESTKDYIWTLYKNWDIRDWVNKT